MIRLGTLVIALLVMSSTVQAQSDTARSRRDTSRAQTQQRNQRDTSRAQRRTAQSGGDVVMTRRSLGLTRAQTVQLQQALRQVGCDPGPADGVIGNRTREAIACAREQKGIQGNDMNELLRALQLDFTVSNQNTRQRGDSATANTRARNDTTRRNPRP